MNRLARRTAAVLLALLARAALGVPAAGGAELIRERFERVAPGVPFDCTVSGRDGTRRGFSLSEPKRFVTGKNAFEDLPVAFDNAASRGAISFDLQRKAGDVTPERRTVFEILDSAGGQILTFQVQWPSDYDPALPMFSFRGEEYWRYGSGLWSQEILLDRGVSPGQWIHVDIVWDDGARKYHLFVDGRPQDTFPKSFVAKGHSVRPDRRLDVNALLVWKKGVPSPEQRPFSRFLSKATAFRIGVNSHPRKPHTAASFLSQSVLDNFVVLSGEWPGKVQGGPEIRSVSDDSFRVPGISGSLVAGDTVTVTLVAAPGGTATFDMGRARGIAMKEVAPSQGGGGSPATDNGTYRGSYTIRPGDDFTDGRIVGRFVSADNAAAPAVPSDSPWRIDTKPRVTFAIDHPDLSADERSSTRVKISVRDANGTPVVGRKLALTLSTTGEYTGLVGSGRTRTAEIAGIVRDALGGAEAEAQWGGDTDRFGEAVFEYASGFAAKTVILQVKDLESGGVAVDFITAYKEASIDIRLTPPVSSASARRGPAYQMRIEATRTRLTADGRSRSVVRATLLDPSGRGVEGEPVEFSLSSPIGTLRTVSGVTDRDGTATAEYTAGKRIGVVVVTARATVRNVSAGVSIVLESDAPAKVLLSAKPPTLPADGSSRAVVSVKVTDVNDNPNDNTEVEFRIASGGGRLEYATRVTDRTGDAEDRYTAGNVPGVARILATVRSRVPTEEELSRARNVLFAPYSPEGREVRVTRWLKRVGETATRGEAVAEYTVGRTGETRTLEAPCDCRIDFRYVETWDWAATGDTLALFTPIAVPGAPSSPPAAVVEQRTPRGR